MELPEISDIIVFVVFHALLFYCWRRMILFLKKEDRKYLKLGWAFIGLYCFLFLLLLFVGAIGDGVGFVGIKIPLYVPFGLILVYFSIRLIQPINAEMIKRIKKILTEEPKKD